ncbi:kinase-like domain-containing protein [Lentinula edodes]|nr:kinase-like domain-containing protein [Lentinula edodes]
MVAHLRPDGPAPPNLELILPNETWWVEHFDYLKEHGYVMRPRYRPGWKPSYKLGTHEFLEREDGQALDVNPIMDAIRSSDSLMVAIKRVKTSSSEVQVGTLFSNDEHASNPSNHCIRILEVLSVPETADEVLLVMPWLREVDSPSFRTIGEILQFTKEMIEGLQYMHKSNVAHRDCSINNMAMDAKTMYPHQYHPRAPERRYDWTGRVYHRSRTHRPPRYYLIDFGFSQKYDPSQPRPLEYAIKSGGYLPPEGAAVIPCDPFATDVFLLGNMIRTSFLDVIDGLEFLRPLVNDMIVDDPFKRPNMDEVASRFSIIMKIVPSWELRSRAIRKNEFPLLKPFRAIHHLLWTTSMMLLLKPAIPTPTKSPRP